MRYTRKDTDLPLVIKVDDPQRATKKLFILEEVEEELGADLLVIFKALKNGIITKYRNLYTTLTPDRLSIEYKWKCLRKGGEKFYFADYGKTWIVREDKK